MAIKSTVTLTGGHPQVANDANSITKEGLEPESVSPSTAQGLKRGMQTSFQPHHDSAECLIAGASESKDGQRSQ